MKNLLQEAASVESDSSAGLKTCQLLRGAGDSKVYLELDGVLHHVPNPATYEGLFTDWNVIQDVNSLSAYTVGDPLTDGAKLMYGDD